MKNMKKTIFFSLCIIIGISISACGMGEKTKRSSKDILADAKKIGDDITCGEFVLNGKVYSFPMKLSEFTNDGWKVSKNFNKSNLDADSFSDTFEIYKGNSKKYLTVSLYNNTDSSANIDDCLIYSLYIRNHDFNVTYPGGLTETSSKEDIINAYGEGSNDDKDNTMKRTYSFDGNNDTSCLVELIASADENSKKPFKSAEYYMRWDTGDMSPEERCKIYFETTMKACFHGEVNEYADAGFDDLEGAKELYNSEMEYYAEALMYYVDIDSSVIDEDLYNQFVEIAEKVLSKTKWSLDELEVDSTYKGKITVTLYPTNYLELINSHVETAIEEFTEKNGEIDYEDISLEEYTKYENEYAENVLSKIEDLPDDISLSTSVTVSYDMDGQYILTDDNWNEIDDIIMGIEED